MVHEGQCGVVPYQGVTPSALKVVLCDRFLTHKVYKGGLERGGEGRGVTACQRMLSLLGGLSVVVTKTFIKKILLFLQVRPVNISNDDIVDGNPKLTLGLMWYIISHFQVRVGRNTFAWLFFFFLCRSMCTLETE